MLVSAHCESYMKEMEISNNLFYINRLYAHMPNVKVCRAVLTLAYREIVQC